MDKEYIYYFQRPGDLEEIATIQRQPLSDVQLQKLIAAIESDGAKYTRCWCFDGSPPDFAATVNV